MPDSLPTNTRLAVPTPVAPGALTVVILTYNEELHLARAIESVRAIAHTVVVVDSFSTDRTVEIARALGTTVLQNVFVHQARQFQWALDNCPLQTPWILRLDADEVLSPELVAEIQRRLPEMPADVTGVYLKRRHIWMGRWVRHGGRYPVVLLRLWRTGRGRIDDRWMDEHVLIDGGRTLTFDEDFSDENLHDIGYFIEKHNRYATREAIEILDERLGFLERHEPLEAQSPNWKRRVRNVLKTQIYGRLPFTVTAPAYFLWRYVFELGFLDGRTGLIYHFLQGYWYRFLVGAKVIELQRAVAHLHDKREIAAELSRLTGQQLRGD